MHSLRSQLMKWTGVLPKPVIGWLTIGLAVALFAPQGFAPAQPRPDFGGHHGRERCFYRRSTVTVTDVQRGVSRH